MIMVTALVIKNKKINKKFVFILEDSIIKNLNGILITNAINNKYIVKVRPFSSVKVKCMYHHVKPTIRDMSPDHVILRFGTNDWNSGKASSQVARSIIDLAVSLKTKIPSRMLRNRATHHICVVKDIYQSLDIAKLFAQIFTYIKVGFI